MKVYLLIECSGEYEYYSERVCAGYLSLKKAEEKKQKLEFIETEHEKCCVCPLYYCPDECNHKCGDECSANNITDDEMKTFCKAYEPRRNKKKPGIASECRNFSTSWCYKHYKIDELEIEE